MTAMRVLLATVLCVGLVGCSGYVSTSPGETVDMSAKVIGPDGKSVAGFQVVLQPTAGLGQEVFFTVKPEGMIAGKAVAGTYTYYLRPGVGAANEQALAKFPASVRAGAMDRTVEVKAGAGELQLKF